MKSKLAVLIAGGTFVLAGCGGGSSNGGSSSGTSTSGASGFVAQADSICQQESAAEVSLTRTLITSKSVATSQVQSLIGARNRALTRLKALTPPASHAPTYKAFLGAYPAIEAAWRTGEAKVSNSFPPPGYNIGTTPNQSLELRDKADILARRAGLSACGGQLPASQVKALRSEAVDSQLHPTTSLCTRESTLRFIAAAGGTQACLASTKTRSASANVATINGTLPQAVVFISRSGGNQPAGKLIFYYVLLHGRWMLDDAASG